MASWPDLLLKTPTGGFLVPGYCALFMAGLIGAASGYVEQAWTLDSSSGLRAFGLPAGELMVGLAFGLNWSIAYQHLTWSRAMKCCRPAISGA